MSAQAVLDVADELFYRHGIAAVGMDSVRDQAGVTLRRLYGWFPSKKDLVAAWLNDRHEKWMAWFTSSTQRHIDNGTDPLLAVFDALEEWLSDPSYRGCAFLNAIAETTEIDERHRAIVASHKQALVAYIAGLATQSHPTAPEWLAQSVGVFIDGAIVQCAVFGVSDPLVAARNATQLILSHP
jgi:AcrR family transcriptional regulator